MVRLFADECVPSSIIQILRDSGHDVIRLRDYIPINSSDDVVISQTQELGAVLVSLNGDFADIVAYPPARYKGIIALQIRNHPEVIPQLMDRLAEYLSDHPAQDHYNGKLVLAEVHRIRIRE